MVTLHTIVHNEERFIRQALIAALSSKKVVRAIVWDTGSTDKTVERIRSVIDKRIEFEEKGKVDRTGLVVLRNKQIELTETPWLLLVDGDEIWPRDNLRIITHVMEICDANTIALVNRTRNVVGDFLHYLPDSEGNYQIGPWKGHLNIRAIRNISGLKAKGEYPNEWYEINGKKIQNISNRLRFVNAWYLHATHLKRSGNWFSEFSTTDRWKKYKWLWRIRRTKLLTMNQSELPEALI